MMRYVVPMMAFFLLCWVVMVILSYFQPWLLLPDITMISMVYFYYFSPKAPLWRCLFPLTILMDMSANVCLGFHGVLYALTALVVFPLRPYWQMTSLFEQLFAVIFFALGYIVVKFLMLYVVEGIPAPNGWLWTVVMLLVVWPLMRGLTGWLVFTYFPREHS